MTRRRSQARAPPGRCCLNAELLIQARGETMDIRLQRAWDPSDMRAWDCTLCEQPFVVGSVRAAESADGQSVCPACVEHFGKRNSERFPTIVEYEAALLRYPDPIYASLEELERRDPWMM